MHARGGYVARAVTLKLGGRSMRRKTVGWHSRLSSSLALTALLAAAACQESVVDPTTPVVRPGLLTTGVYADLNEEEDNSSATFVKYTYQNITRITGEPEADVVMKITGDFLSGSTAVWGTGIYNPEAGFTEYINMQDERVGFLWVRASDHWFSFDRACDEGRNATLTVQSHHQAWSPANEFPSRSRSHTNSKECRRPTGGVPYEPEGGNCYFIDEPFEISVDGGFTWTTLYWVPVRVCEGPMQ